MLWVYNHILIMDKLIKFNIKEIIIFTFLQVILIRFVAVPIVKTAIIDTFNENGIMCGYESDDSTEK